MTRLKERFEALFDGVRAAEFLREAGVRIDSADLDYSRLKPGENAMLGYLFSGREESGAPVVLPGYVRVFPDDRARVLVEKWKRKGIRPTPLGPGVRLLPDGRSVLVLFPHDGRLGDLAQVASPAKLKRLLGTLPAAEGGRVSEAASRVETVRYKPERRWVASADLRIRHPQRGRTKLRAFLRLFPDDRGARTARVVESLRRGGLGDSVPRPLGVLQEGRLYVEETVRGEQLIPCIHRGVDCAPALASVLHRLHDADPPAAGAPDAADPLGRAQDLAAVLARTDKRLQAVAEGVVQAMAALRPHARPSRLIHGDFHPEQVLVVEERPVLVDFERAAVGDPLQDVGNFAARILGLTSAEPFGVAALRRFLRRFLSAYVESSSRPQSDLVFFVLLGLLECALETQRRRAPGWRDAAATLLRYARDLAARPEALHNGRATTSTPPCDVAYPHAHGDWAGYRMDAGTVEYGVLRPESGVFLARDPARDPVLPHLRDWMRQGELVSYRVGRRAVVCDSAGDYVKIVKQKRARRQARRHRRLRAMLDLAGDDAPRVPLLRNPDGEGGVLRFEAVAATSLHRLLMTPGKLVGKEIEAVGCALARLHGASAAGVDLPVQRRDTAMQWVEHLRRGAPTIARTYADVAIGLPRVPSPGGGASILHGDLHDKNILVDRPRVWLIDLDAACVGDPAADLGNLCAHLILRSMQSGRSAASARNQIAQLTRAYREAGGDLRLPGLRAWTAHTLFRLSCLYMFRRAWRRLSRPLLDEVRRWSDTP